MHESTGTPASMAKILLVVIAPAGALFTPTTNHGFASLTPGYFLSPFRGLELGASL
jgi:hypothetical protein